MDGNGETPIFSCNDLVHHPIATTIQNWLLRVPGMNF